MQQTNREKIKRTTTIEKRNVTMTLPFAKRLGECGWRREIVGEEK
jgi:hypothetical protein